VTIHLVIDYEVVDLVTIPRYPTEVTIGGACL
jgi:hypothetical protein